MSKIKGKKIDGIYDVLSVFSKKDGVNRRLMAVPASDKQPESGTFFRRGDYVFVPKRRRGEKFKVIYTTITETDF